MPEPPRNPCPTGRHHAHPMQDCQEYDEWRERINAELEDTDA